MDTYAIINDNNINEIITNKKNNNITMLEYYKMLYDLLDLNVFEYADDEEQAGKCLIMLDKKIKRMQELAEQRRNQYLKRRQILIDGIMNILKDNENTLITTSYTYMQLLDKKEYYGYVYSLDQVRRLMLQVATTPEITLNVYKCKFQGVWRFGYGEGAKKLIDALREVEKNDSQN